MEPENFYKAAKEVVQMGFNGIDINMGCPERNALKKGACIGLIKNRSLASEIIKATQEGAEMLPVSIKTRIGLTQIQTEDWIPFLLEHNLDAISVHGRTAKELSAVPVHWDEIGKAVQIRDELYERILLSERSRGQALNRNPSTSSGNKTLIIGNGDVKNYSDAVTKVTQYKVDGVMIGRGIFQDLWAFERKDHHRPPVRDMITLMLKHCHLFHNTWGDTKSFLILRKFFKIYVSGFEGASELREQVMKTKSVAEVESIVNDFLATSKV
jgi:tRNA-dihydrouridine synthase